MGLYLCDCIACLSLVVSWFSGFAREPLLYLPVVVKQVVNDGLGQPN